ncbi:MAG: DUF748 domain-containing protein [Chitinispirillaceae bacterium]
MPMTGKRKILTILLLIVLGLTLLRYALGYTIRWYLNSRIDEMENISGSVGRVGINPLEGIYSLGDIELRSVSDTMDAAVSIESAGFNLGWGTLFSGAVAGEIFIIRPGIRIVSKISTEQEVPPRGPPLARVFRNFAPLQLDVITIADGEVIFRDETQPAPLEIDITEINGDIRNLTNTQRLSEDLFASGDVHGIVLGSGDLTVSLSIAPTAEELQFSLFADISGIELSRLNDFLDELAGITLDSGTLSIDMDISAEQGTVSGSARTAYENLEFRDSGSDAGFFEQLKEGIADIGADIIEDEDERIVTNVPFSFTTGGTEPDVLFTVMTILQRTITLSMIPIVGDIAGEQPD